MILTNNELKKYKKNLKYSYTFGMFPTFELLKNRPETIVKIVLHSKLAFDIREKIILTCKKKKVDYTESDKVVEKLRDKESCLLIGVFEKYHMTLDFNDNHIVLVNPSDSGNVGTIIRTALGFGIHNIAIIEPAVDLFNPKTVRASMGALFSMNIQLFESFEKYKIEYGRERKLYPFMLQAKNKLGQIDIENNKFALIFGNEATGLDDSFLKVGQSVIISHSDEIDSLNLSLAAGIAIYEFSKKYFN